MVCSMISGSNLQPSNDHFSLAYFEQFSLLHRQNLPPHDNTSHPDLEDCASIAITGHHIAALQAGDKPVGADTIPFML